MSPPVVMCGHGTTRWRGQPAGTSGARDLGRLDGGPIDGVKATGGQLATAL